MRSMTTESKAKEIRIGMIEFFNADRGYGVLKDIGDEVSVYFHVRSLTFPEEDACPGMLVRFIYGKRYDSKEKRLRPIAVMVSDARDLELQKTGINCFIEAETIRRERELERKKRKSRKRGKR